MLSSSFGQKLEHGKIVLKKRGSVCNFLFLIETWAENIESTSKK